MKKLFFAMLFCNFAFLSYSQDLQFASGREKYDSKPSLFQGISTRFSFKTLLIEDIISNARLQQELVVDLTPGYTFNGKVTAINNDAPGLTTVTIQSITKDGVLLTFSKLVLPDQTISYRGMIQSKNHNDMLMLEQDPVTGLYNWNKKMVSHLLSD